MDYDTIRVIALLGGSCHCEMNFEQKLRLVEGKVMGVANYHWACAAAILN